MFSLQIFAGNFDRNSIVVHEMLPPFYASMVKIHPVSYYGWMSMRVELFGCPIKVRKASSSNHDFQDLCSGHKARQLCSLMGGFCEWVKPVERDWTLYGDFHEMFPVNLKRDATDISVHRVKQVYEGRQQSTCCLVLPLLCYREVKRPRRWGRG